MKNQFEPSIKLVFKYYQEFQMPFDVSPQDTLVEVRQYLAEATPLFLYANFHFEVNNKRVNEYQDIGSNGIVDESVVSIVLDEYDERSARFHIKKTHEALNNPGLLSLLNERPQKPGAQEDFPFNSSVQKVLSYEEDSKQEQSNPLQLSDVLKPQLQIQLLLEQPKNKNFKFINALTYSGFNPPSQVLKMKGHLFYLLLRTLENTEYHITVTPIGFYVNKSNQRVFDPEVNTQYSCQHSLVELIKEVSPLFRKEFQQLAELKGQVPQSVQLLSSLKYNHQWLGREQVQEQVWDPMRNESWALNLHGLDISSVRDWNEELQVFRDLPKSDFLQKINRDKALVKVHGDFLDAAIKGAMAVVDKIIQPLNPMDTELQQVYVYNHIFFSFAMETPDNFRQESGMDATPTVSTTNCDFRNLKLLHRLEIPELHLLNAALVDYKGRRVIAQSIIPGILNSDHSNCTQYGSIDEGKTIQKSPQFHSLMSKVCEYFHLDDSIVFLDAADNEHEMAAGIEVKGILGSDKRMYLLDLLRLSPRDLNYADDVLHQCCVLRPELIQNFYVQSAFEKLKNVDEAKEQLSKIQRILQGNDKSSLKLNAAISTNVKLKPSEKIDEQKKELQKIADYLINKSIPLLVQDLKQPERQQDTNSISDLFHAHGVNMRYLGVVAKHIDQNEFPSVFMQLERTCLTKSLKHIFRQAMRETSQTNLAEVLSHLLNATFGSVDVRKQLDEEFSNDKDVQQDKKKKKKKKKSVQTQGQSKQNFQVKSLITQQQSTFLKIKPSELWERMCEIAKNRYSHIFPKHYDAYYYLNYNFFNLSCLRELCQLIGLKIACIPYDLQESTNLPFQPHHIIQIEPVIKFIEVQSEDEKLNLELGQKFFVEGKLQEALECYLTSAQIIMNLYGTIHRDLAICFSKISAIYYKRMEYETSIQFQRQAVSINMNIYGLDNIQTATSLTNLAFYYFGIKKHKEAFNYMLHALYLYNLVGGEAHQEVFNQFTNLSLLYSETGQHQAALNSLFEALDRCENLHSKQTNSSALKIAGYYQAIALEHSELGDVQKAVEFQTKAVSLLKQFDQNDFRTKESEKLLENLTKAFQEKKKNANTTTEVAPKRAFGTNRVVTTKQQEPKPEPQETQETDKEREELMARVRQAKLNAKHGFRRGQYDINRLLGYDFKRE